MDDKLEKLTEEILLRNDIYKIPADIIVIAQNNNIDVYKMKMPDEKIMGLIKYDKDTSAFVIAINKELNTNQQRFTLAHELGHFFLDKEQLMSEEIHIDVMFRITNEKDEKEVEYFAGALLMNKTLLEKTYETVRDIKELSKLFEVSEADMTYRLNILGLL